MRFDAVLVGIGGQGVITTARVLASAALACGIRVKVTELVGVAQRGSVVIDQIRLGDGIHSPTIPDQRAHVILGFEPAETVRISAKFLAPEGLVVVNTAPIPPLSVVMGQESYPSLTEILKLAQKTTPNVVALDATAIASQIGGLVMVGSVLLGVLTETCQLPVEPAALATGFEEVFAGAVAQQNLRAFNLGRRAGKEKTGVRHLPAF